ncbi:hypothetical protein ED28_03075 [[Pantoea] beijingensis]|uniref:CFA/I fimbrial subunit C n=1 Tax=[Pantoea] beijingensis TaxID=1324864 RepID=A0A443IGV2_9GAMM|nr:MULTISPECIES: TcfC E-set like domain-containing protein [Erwiniaceae]RWR03293.1 hypothetical protein ED28_03075 [[Pantoea] beijingensis]
MNKKIIFGAIYLGGVASIAPYAFSASDVILPSGFEDIFNQKQNGVFSVIYNDISIGTLSADYDLESVTLYTPRVIAEQITAKDMPELKESKQALLHQLSQPLKRVKKRTVQDDGIVVWVNEKDASLHLVLPAAMFKDPSALNDRTFIRYTHQPGFVHSHNLNFLSDSYSDSFSLSSDDTLNLTGNSYVKGSWSYSDDINFNLDELALYLEYNANRMKLGRQRLSDALLYSTPSLTYSFFNPMSYDGVSLGYMTDNYLQPVEGAASPIPLYMPMAGTVEVYRNGRIIDLQQFPAGMQQLNTNSWPAGGYDVVLVSKFANGSREEKHLPFFKRNGMFRSGDLEYSMQLGRYDLRQGHLLSKRNNDCYDCNPAFQDSKKRVNDNYLAGVMLGYTTSSALSLGGGALLDHTFDYYNASVDIPLNYWFAERLYSDAIVGGDGSYGYQVGVSKNLYDLGVNVSYRSNRYKGKEENYRRFGLVPAYDFEYLQFGVSTFLPFDTNLSVLYSMNSLYQDYGRQDKSNYRTWDVTLNRDFIIDDNINLRVDLGYHQGINRFNGSGQYSSRQYTDDQVFAQLTLGMREKSYNHYQSLYLKSRLSDKGADNNIYSADYSLDVKNPAFDRGGKYALSGSLSNGPNYQTSSNIGGTVDNSLGYTSAGISRSYGKGNYQQYYLSQRSGFAVSHEGAAFGKIDNSTALVVDATDLPEDQYFEVRNQNSGSVIVKGGRKTTLPVQPYQKVAPTTEQVFTGETNAFYNLATKSTSTWALPGQVYNVKLEAKKNQTVTGRIYYDGTPLTHARVVGGNTVTDEEGLFVGDFVIGIKDKLTSLNVKKDSQNYICPLDDKNIKMTQGIMQIREVECEIE